MAHYLSLRRLLDVEIPIRACWMKYSQVMIECAGPKFDVQQTAREIQAVVEDSEFWAQVKKYLLSHVMTRSNSLLTNPKNLQSPPSPCHCSKYHTRIQHSP